MNLKRFTGRTSRDALALVRQSFGPDAVVMSTRPCAEGVEVLAMAPESVQQLEKLSATAPAAAPARPAPRARPQPREEQTVDDDVEQRVVHQHFGRATARVVVAGHAHAVSAR